MKIQLYISTIIFLSACTSLNEIPHLKKDLLDEKQNVTKSILDTKAENWNENYINSLPDSSKLKILFDHDTFAVIKPVINVYRVKNESWNQNTEVLDANITDNVFRIGELENNYEFDWYNYIHKYSLGPGPIYIPCLSESDYVVIKKEIVAMEQIFDNNNLTDFTMSDSLYNALSKISASYYILYDLKERWCGHTTMKGGGNYNDFMRIRIFIFNKKTKKILYYNREHRQYQNFRGDHEYVPSLNVLLFDFNKFHSSFYKMFSKK